MTSQDAVTMVTDYVRETGLSATEAVKTLWPKLQPIDKGDAETLMQFALAALVVHEYKRPPLEDVVQRDQSNHRITVHYRRHKMKRYEVGVQLLHDVHYSVNGKVKSIATCNRYDLLSLARNAGSAEQGFARYRQTWEYIAERLQQLKKNRVEDLEYGDKQKIARMIHDCQSFRFPSDLPSPNQKALQAR